MSALVLPAFGLTLAFGMALAVVEAVSRIAL